MIRDLPRFIETVRELRLEQRRAEFLVRHETRRSDGYELGEPGRTETARQLANANEMIERLKREIDLELGI